MVLLILPGSRDAATPGPTIDNQHLVVISRMGVSNTSFPTLDIDEYERWRVRARHWFTEFSFYRMMDAKIQFDNRPGRTISLGVASASLPALLELRLSSEAMDQARARHQPALILTRSGADQYFGATSALVGQTVKISGREALIVGVLPGYAPLLPQREDAWLIVNEPQLAEYATGARGFVLAQSSKAAEDTGSNGRWNFSMNENGDPVGFDCVPLRGQIPHPTHTFLFALLLAFLALPATTPLPLGEYPAAEHPLFSQIRWRRWVFLGVKMGLLILIVCFTSTILAFGNNRVAPLTSEYIQLVTSFVGLLFSFRWALRDQRLRCPVCLRRLSNPVQVGYPSRCFLAWHGTEFMCDEGHGLLHVPEMATSWFSTQRWLSLDPSWQGLFPTLIQR